MMITVRSYKHKYDRFQGPVLIFSIKKSPPPCKIASRRRLGSHDHTGCVHVHVLNVYSEHYYNRPII